MEWIQGMNAAVNYIEEHILEEPDLNELGKLAGCSAHHFQRIFTYIGGLTLTEYLRKRRMCFHQSFSNDPWGYAISGKGQQRFIKGISAACISDDCERNTGNELQN